MSQAEFDQAASDVKNLSAKPCDNDLLMLYGLFKQATIGDINISKPGMLDFKDKAKWEAWDKNKGKTQEKARQEYIDFVKVLKQK